MRKTFLAITLFLAFSKAALAQFGNCTASEMRTYVDSATGSTITPAVEMTKRWKVRFLTEKNVNGLLHRFTLLKWPPVRLFKLRKDRTWAVLFWLIKRIVCLSAGKKKKTGTCM